ncbi:GGDEF domain-containing protein [Photobacterium atrarenae]|uniref:diguanylate cyclase n=1 Tax=Photobacterium atrarenae TaxID=865757 RepID=A0ABY5GNF9_9GAMM|nr:GGDEF domain-containing protein [Photobacterium atrarenae]UTV30087.1 GGDEF domain-containing protein [Photobacterium atrarenae]
MFIPTSHGLDIPVSILTLVLLVLLIREASGTEMRGWLILSLGTYGIGLLADLLDEIPELSGNWLLENAENSFMHIGVFLLCFCFNKLLQRYRALTSSLNAQIHKARDLETKLSRMALEDELTGLQNRLALFRRFDYMAINNQRGLLAYIDLDNFKHVNDQYGHKQGDELLREIAALLVKTAPTGSQAYRIGGDEFVVLLPCEDQQRYNRWIERLYQSVKPITERFQIDLSIGLAVYYSGNLSDPDSLLATADKNMYCAKTPKPATTPAT